MLKFFIGSVVFLLGGISGFFVSTSLEKTDLQTNTLIQPLQVTSSTTNNLAPSQKGGSCN